MEVVLVTAGYDHSIKYWNVLEGTCIHSIQHNESHINRLAISNDKRFLAVAGNPCIRLYDNTAITYNNNNTNTSNTSNNNNTAATNNKNDGTPVALLEGHRSNVTAVGWNYEGRWLWSASEDGTARVWDVRTQSASTSTSQSHHGKCEREFAAKYPLCDAALHPDQSELATVDERGVLRVWALQGKECLFESVPEVDAPLPVALQSVTFSPDGAMIACCSANGMVFVYCKAGSFDENGTSLLSSLSASSSSGSVPLSASPSSSTSSSAYRLVSTFRAHNHYITRITFTPDGQSLCTCSADGTCRLFAIPATSNHRQPEQEERHYYGLERTLSGHQRWVWDCAFSADSAYIITASSDTTARLFERRTGDTVSVFTGHSKAITCVALNDIP